MRSTFALALLGAIAASRSINSNSNKTTVPVVDPTYPDFNSEEDDTLSFMIFAGQQNKHYLTVNDYKSHKVNFQKS